MNRIRRKPTSCSTVPGSSSSRSCHCATLLPFRLSFPSIHFLSSSFSFFYSLLPFLLVLLLLSQTALSFPFNLCFHRIDSPLPYFGDTWFPCVILTMPSFYKLSFPCGTWSPCSLLCGIHHPHGSSCDRHDAMWHHATCYPAICSFHFEISEIPTISEFNVILQGN